MRQSKLFTKTRKEAPADETSKNAQLLIRAGYIHKEMAGVYDYLPLGLLVIQKIKKIVAEEMEKLGSIELLMSTLQRKELWDITHRWDDTAVDVWFKSKLKNDTEVGFGWSHEEPITDMMKSFISSYADIESSDLSVRIAVHQFQNKLRNEVRAKSGIMRCREFIMKDMYSYARTESEHMDFYNKAMDAYRKVYERVGLGNITYVTSASGGVFTDKFSHEFQTVCDAGEDNIYVHTNGKLALNEEIFNDETLAKLNEAKENFELKKAAEVGNIFTFGTKKCEELGLVFADETGEKKAVFLGSYGIGITRLMGVLVEVCADEKGIVWPESVAPFQAHLLALGTDTETTAAAEKLYGELTAQGIEILFDDRDVRAGEKFADADLIGIPWRVVISAKTLAEGKVEVKKRTESEANLMTEQDMIRIVSHA